MSLYRTILRGTKRIADPATRAESRKYARDEFDRHRGVSDAVSLTNTDIYISLQDANAALQKSQIRYLLSRGKTEWEGMERYIDGM